MAEQEQRHVRPPAHRPGDCGPQVLNQVLVTPDRSPPPRAAPVTPKIDRQNIDLKRWADRLGEVRVVASVLTQTVGNHHHPSRPGHSPPPGFQVDASAMSEWKR